MEQKKSQGARPGFLKSFTRVLTFGYSLKAWCPVRDSNPHARALGSKPNVSTNSTNWASRYVRAHDHPKSAAFWQDFSAGKHLFLEFS